MWAAVSSAFSNMITLVGQFLTALTGENGALAGLLPLFAIGIAISLVMVAVKIKVYGLAAERSAVVTGRIAGTSLEPACYNMI